MGEMATCGGILPQWNPAISVGDPRLDHEHQILFEQIALVGNLADSAATPALDRLLETLDQHCQGEERFFSATDYPYATAHRIEHRVLRHLARHICLSAGLAAEPAVFRLSLRHFLQAMIEHIIEIDQGYRPYLER